MEEFSLLIPERFATNETALTICLLFPPHCLPSYPCTSGFHLVANHLGGIHTSKCSRGHADLVLSRTSFFEGRCRTGAFCMPPFLSQMPNWCFPRLLDAMRTTNRRDWSAPQIDERASIANKGEKKEMCYTADGMAGEGDGSSRRGSGEYDGATRKCP